VKEKQNVAATRASFSGNVNETSTLTPTHLTENLARAVKWLQCVFWPMYTVRKTGLEKYKNN